MLEIFPLVISQYLPWVDELNIGAFSLTVLTMLPMVVAVVSSVWLIHWVIQKRGSAVSQGGRIGWYISGYGAYLLAFFVSFIVGGPLGAKSVGYIIEAIGGYFGIATGGAFYTATVFVVGVSVGTFIVTVIPCLLFASLGYQLGSLMHRLVQRFAGQGVITWADWRTLSTMLLLLIIITLLLIFVLLVYELIISF